MSVYPTPENILPLLLTPAPMIISFAEDVMAVPLEKGVPAVPELAVLAWLWASKQADCTPATSMKMILACPELSVRVKVGCALGVTKTLQATHVCSEHSKHPTPGTRVRVVFAVMELALLSVSELIVCA